MRPNRFDKIVAVEVLEVSMSLNVIYSVKNNDLRVDLRRFGDLGTHNLRRDQGHYELEYEIIWLADKIVSYF